MTPKLKSIAFVFTLIVLFKLLPTPVTAQIDSLRHLLEHCHDSAKYRISTELADELYYAGNLDESIRHYSQAAEIELKRKKTDPENVARAMANTGYCYYEKAQYPKAAETYQTALEYAVQATDSLLLSDIYVNFGNSWFYLGNYEKRVPFFSKALSVDQAMGNQKFTGINLNNLGKVFEARKQSEKAIDFYMQALKISKQMNDSNSMAIRLSNIGT